MRGGAEAEERGRWYGIAAGLAFLIPLWDASAQTLGVATDSRSPTAVVFDARSGAVFPVTLPPPVRGLGEAAVLSDGSLAFVGVGAGQVFVIDLRAQPPRLADGINPIAVTGSNATGLALTQDERFLLVGDGGIATVDVTTRTQVSRFDLFTTDDLAPCRDGSLLTTINSGNFTLGEPVLRLRIDAAGRLTDTAERFTLTTFSSVACAPDGRSAINVNGLSGTVQSLLVQGLQPVSSVVVGSTLANFSSAQGFSPRGDRFYAAVRDTNPQFGGLRTVFRALAYDPATARLGASLATREIFEDPAVPFVGPLGIHPDGSRLYLARPGKLQGLDPNTLADDGFVAQAPALFLPVNIALPRFLRTDLDRDGDVDRNDLAVLTQNLRRPAAQATCGTGCDLDGDGQITVLDGTRLVRTCTLASCQIPMP